MAKGKVRSSNRPTIARSIVLSVMLTMIVLLLGAVLLTALVYSGTVDEGFIRYMAMVAVGISSFLGTFFATRQVEDNIWIKMAGSGAINYLLLLCLNVLVFDGRYAGLGWGTLAFIIGMLLALLLNIAAGRPRKKGSYKYRYR